MQTRNIGIIAHVDHGKSTLADRMLELSGAVDKRKARPQLLDMMDLERERGITIKMQPARIPWRNPDIPGESVVINLIDTPGHIDFSYEVSRALKAVEGVILLVDATQGIQAQTLAVLQSACEEGLAIIPVLSKVDLPTARVDEMRLSLASLLSVDPASVLLASGKTGAGVAELMDEVVRRVPPPSASLEKEGAAGVQRALVFDFQYSEHQGVILFVRVFEGSFHKGDALELLMGSASFQAAEVGVFVPERVAQVELEEGAIGYIVTGIKEPGIARIGDTVAARGARTPALRGFREPLPMVWASLYPESQDDFDCVRRALERIHLTDASVWYEEESSGILGRGFRVGFLGMLHMEIILERLRREFHLSFITTQPSLAYEVELRTGKRETVRSAHKFPDYGMIQRVLEPWVRARIITPPEHLDAIMPLLYEFEATMTDLDEFPDGRIAVVVEMPLRELMRGFHDNLKSISSGYASLSYEPLDMREGALTRLDVLIAEEEVPALARVVPLRRLEEEAKKIVAKLKETLPRQLFVLKIQARALGRILASERLAALRKDVTGHLYGGDVTRKRKLLEKQKKGKKRLLASAKVRIPPETFSAILKEGF
ncbi:MAG: elongation factor 4 [Candidatus Parcubacteria bacterium]|nr:MAG: elongation factor 4 [Candidatus Parcubacteria bacterium]